MKQMLTDVVDRGRKEIVFRKRKLHCGPGTEVVSHATPPPPPETQVGRNKMFVWFNKNDNLKSHFRTSQNAIRIKKPKCSHLGSP